MNIISSEHYRKFDYQISSVCFSDLPRDKFNLDSRNSSGIWMDFLIRTIWLTYFSLILNNTIEIQTKIISRRILFGLVKFEQIVFVPRLKDKKNSDESSNWLEKQIITSVGNDYSKEEDIVRLQFNILGNIILGADTEYNSPDTELLKRLMLYDNHKYWDCTFDEKMFNIKRYAILKIDNDIKSNLNMVLFQIESLEKELTNRYADLNSFKRKVKKAVKHEIGKRTIFRVKDSQ